MPPTRPNPLRCTLAAAVLACAPLAARAQQPASAPASPGSPGPAAAAPSPSSPSITHPDTTPAGCPRIGNIFVDNNSVFLVGDASLDPRFNRAYRTANRLHVRTREAVIRRELLFREGSCYRPELLEDSERILRSTGYLADADVFSVRQDDGTYDVIVETRDEWSTRLEASAGSSELSGIELREDNLLGRGARVAAFWRHQEGESVYGGRAGTPQLFGTHVDAEASLARTPVGVSAMARLAFPFRGEGARWAWRQSFWRDERNFQYFVEDDGRLQRRLFPVFRTAWDAGVVRRFGRRGHLTLLGVALAGERRTFPQDTFSTVDPGVPVSTLPGGGFVPGLEPVSATRLLFLAGQRRVTFDRRRGLDAVHGAEDVQLGADVEAAVGRSIEAFTDGNDLSVDFALNAAGDLPGGLLAGTRVVLEAKRDFEAPDGEESWRDVFGQADVWTYWRPHGDSRHTFVAAVHGAGGWHTRVPFQLTVGQRTGLRGYTRQVAAGQRRVVATLEHRAFLAWPFPRLFDLGSALFVDAGKTWSGGDPFGRDSPVLVSAGAGVRLAFPPGSRRTYRLDFAIPVAPSFRPGAVQISIGTGQAVGRTALEDDAQIGRSSRQPIGVSLFDYPIDR